MPINWETKKSESDRLYFQLRSGEVIRVLEIFCQSHSFIIHSTKNNDTNM